MFKHHIQNTNVRVGLLLELVFSLETGRDYVAAVADEVVELERVGDDAKERFHLTVDKTLITRLHKDDIDKLVHELDLSINQIKKVAAYEHA